MSDLLELYTSPDFNTYQDLMVDEVVSWVQTRLTNGTAPDAIKAGMDLAKSILFIPASVAARPDVAKRVNAAIQARLIAIPALLLRRELKT